MDKFEAQVKTFIERNNLPQNGCRLIIGFSGGADSTALAVVLNALGYKCIAAHCNFQLRGDESYRDESHAVAIAHKIGIDIETIRFDVDDYIAMQKRPTSLEMACRDLRYGWFKQLRDTHQSEAIAVGHHAEDNVETMLLNLIRGTGLTGVRGMLPLTDSFIIRPLLECTRTDIEDYLSRRAISFITDSTNRESIFSRNKLRNEILTSLYESFPNAINGFSSSLKHLRQSEAFLNNAIRDKMKQYSGSDGSIFLRELLDSESEVEYILYEYLKPFGINYSQISDIVASAHTSGKRFPCIDGYFFTDRGTLRHSVENVTAVRIDEIYTITQEPIMNFQPSGRHDEIYLDAEVLDHGPLTVRYWREGDRIRPFGMKGSKAVSDIFSDAKIPLGYKNKIPLLCSGDDILWITGLRASALYPVTDKSKTFLRIKFSPDEQKR